MRSIRVTGKGKIKVHPDITRITLTLSGVEKDYAEALARSAQETEALKELLTEFGFERSDLKTLSFDVDTKYEYYQSHGDSKKRFAGYEFTHRLKVEFSSDNKMLGKILYALAASELHPDFQISYTVADPEASKNELLGKAVKDAMTKASVLADVSGVKLLDIQSIDYSWSELDIEVGSFNNLCKYDGSVGGGSLVLDIEPDDIDLTDTVTVVWEIG